jgi:glycosyltransferase involved in cell wall biosynthesis
MMGSLRVLFVINGLGTGGAERSLAEMLPIFVREGVEPIVATLRRRSDGVEGWVRSEGYDVRLVDGARWPARLRGVRKLIRSERPDLVHTTIFEADVAGRIAAWGTGVPVLTSLVNTSYTKERLADPRVGQTKLAAVRLIDAWTSRHLTHHFHAITNAVKDAAVSSLGIPPQRITVVERGRDPARLGIPGAERRRCARQGLGIREDAEVLVNVGRQEYQKGQRHLLEAMASLAGSRARLVLLVAGREGHASAELKELHDKLGLVGRVRFLGHRPDVPELLAAADAFVFPSLYEGLGGAVIEAMALGLPVIASNLPALREVVDDGLSGLLVAPCSAHAIVDAVTTVLGTPHQGRAMGRRGRAIFEERFTLERSALRMLALYRSIVRAASEAPVRAGAP